MQCYDLRMGRRTVDLIGEAVTNVKFSHDGNCMLASSTDSSIKLLDLQSGSMLNEYKGHANDQYKVEACFTNDDAYVLSGSENNEVVIWDLVEGNVV